MAFQLSRRHFAQAGLSVLATGALQLPASAQERPDVARVLCGYPAGGSVDVVCRKLADRLAGGYARTAMVESRTGAAGRLAVEALKAAPADGSVLLVTPASVLTMYPHIYRPLGYDVFADLAPVGIVAQTGFALAVGPAVPVSVRNVEDFARWCRANPASAHCGNAGAGSLPHFLAMLLAREERLDLVHVPFRGGLAAMQAVAGGQASAAFATESAAIALEQAGKLRVLATSGQERSPFLPQAPTFQEQGLRALTQREWFAAFMPSRAPAGAVSGAAAVLAAGLRDPDLKEVWQKLGLLAEGSTSLELQLALRREYDFWGPVIRASGFKAES
jgi:tripartite-type tricarboxylate transporter receptor subunit TctC